MEPSGRNRSQPVANGTAAKTAQTGETVAVGCDQLPKSFHGKEGVDGSSPSEGSLHYKNCPQMKVFVVGVDTIGHLPVKEGSAPGLTAPTRADQLDQAVGAPNRLGVKQIVLAGDTFWGQFVI